MEGRICVYSGTGNTMFACKAIARRVESIRFELFDIVKGSEADLAGADIVGFATFADFFGPPMRMKTFIDQLPIQRGTPAFLFNTYGAISGKTLDLLDRWTCGRGFRTVASHSLHTPENYPPMISKGRTFAEAPNTAEQLGFERFIVELNDLGHRLAAGESLPQRRPRIGLFRFLPTFPRTQSRRAMGPKFVDTEACTECGLCARSCPYDAITLEPTPVFDESACYGCWSCYNHCPTEAIYTRKLRGVGRYSGPSEALRAKLEG